MEEDEAIISYQTTMATNAAAAAATSAEAGDSNLNTTGAAITSVAQLQGDMAYWQTRVSLVRNNGNHGIHPIYDFIFILLIL